MAVEYTETFDQILNDLIPQTPGIIRSVAIRELRLTCREFFEKSYAWTVLVENVDVPAGSTPVQVDDGDANTEIVAILNVAFNGQDLNPVGRKPSRVLGTTAQPLSYHLTSNPDEFVVSPVLESPDIGGAEVLVALIPSFTTVVLPRQITLKYYEAIVEGYLSRVYNHPNKPYSSPLQAGQMRHNFVRRIGYYMAQRKQGYNNSQQWTFPPTWNVRRLGGRG